MRNTNVWFNEVCRQAKKKTRRLERLYKTKGKICIEGNRQAWLTSQRESHQLFETTKSKYWRDRIGSEPSNPRQRWKSLGILTGDKCAKIAHLSDGHSAEEFASCFEETVDKIRQSTSSAPPPFDTKRQLSNMLSSFDRVTIEEVTRLIADAPAKQCCLDLVPAWLLKQCKTEFSPFLTELFNSSIETGTVPLDMKTAIIIPRLKKANLSPSELSYYRPVSNLFILSTLLERLVSRRLLKHLYNNNLLPANQSAYRRFHSTETALLRLISDIVMESETGNITLLSLLDMSAAFDTVDHALLSKLEQCYGICEKVYDWISPYLKDRSQ